MVALSGTVLPAADRDAKVITPSNSPVELDPFKAFLFDTPLLTVSVRNKGNSPVAYALRVWIFEADGDLKGTLDYCVGDELGGGMRWRVNIPIDIKGVTLRDRAVVTVLRAGSGRATWTLSYSDADQIDSRPSRGQRIGWRAAPSTEQRQSRGHAMDVPVRLPRGAGRLRPDLSPRRSGIHVRALRRHLYCILFLQVGESRLASRPARQGEDAAK